VTPYYDPMIAKLVASGEDRDEAMLTLAAGLFALRVWPVKTNAAFLLACLNDPDFRAGSATTGLIAARADELTAFAEAGENEWKVASMALFAPYYAAGDEAGASPWAAAFGFRLNAAPGPRITVQHGREQRDMLLEACLDASGFATPIEAGVLAYRDAHPLLFTLPTFAAGHAAVADGAIISPMPGKIIAVDVRQGDSVSKGQRLVTLEAMKMEHSLVAPFDGVVAELNAAEGGQVSEGTLLARIDKGD